MKPHDLASNDIGEESRLLEAEFPDAVDLDAVVRLKVSLAEPAGTWRRCGWPATGRDRRRRRPAPTWTRPRGPIAAAWWSRAAAPASR